MTDGDRKSAWAAALGRIPSGVFIVTARSGDQETGMLASWIQQCSFDPPLVTLAVKRGRYVGDWLKAGEAFVVNILDDTQTDMIGHFGRGFDLGEPAFEGVPVERGDSGVILNEALAFLSCRVENVLPTGDHDLFVARVLGGRMLGEGHSMVHLRKNGLHY